MWQILISGSQEDKDEILYFAKALVSRLDDITAVSLFHDDKLIYEGSSYIQLGLLFGCGLQSSFTVARENIGSYPLEYWEQVALEMISERS